MPHSREAIPEGQRRLNFANRGLGGDPNITTARPVMRRVHREQLEDEVSVQQKMSKLSKTERAAVDKAAERAEIRRAKARERMAMYLDTTSSNTVLIPRSTAGAPKSKRSRGGTGGIPAQSTTGARQVARRQRRYLAIASWAIETGELLHTPSGFTNAPNLRNILKCTQRMRPDYLLKSDLRKYRRISLRGRSSARKPRRQRRTLAS
ncbi:hypothetical protein B0H13DRAFT_1907452 [Mycena leptocephala]|nr:hypothetical protein B0H13DRAFT_1907452 [Mycena leptocephala]